LATGLAGHLKENLAIDQFDRTRFSMRENSPRNSKQGLPSTTEGSSRPFCGPWGELKPTIGRSVKKNHGKAPPLLVFHRVDQLKKLGAIYHFDEGLALGLVADHVNGWGVINADALAQVFVLSNSFG